MAGELSEIYPESEKEKRKRVGIITSTPARLQIDELGAELRKMEDRTGIGPLVVERARTQKIGDIL